MMPFLLITSAAHKQCSYEILPFSEEFLPLLQLPGFQRRLRSLAHRRLPPSEQDWIPHPLYKYLFVHNDGKHVYNSKTKKFISIHKTIFLNDKVKVRFGFLDCKEGSKTMEFSRFALECFIGRLWMLAKRAITRIKTARTTASTIFYHGSFRIKAFTNGFIVKANVLVVEQ